jgi:hypothetical protein
MTESLSCATRRDRQNLYYRWSKDFLEAGEKQRRIDQERPGKFGHELIFLRAKNRKSES